MDVNYSSADWKKMRSSIGDLIGLGRWGKGMIDDLKDITGNLEKAESNIAKYDHDGVISFNHIDRENKYQEIFEDFKVLHNFTGKVEDIVEQTIDQPFYEDLDAFVEKLRDATISAYTTENRIGATEQKIIYARGVQQTYDIDKVEVSLDDILSGDNFFGEQMRLEFEAWQELNPDQEFTYEEYRMAAVNTRAFEYESIKDQQLNKEFWVSIGALVVVLGVGLICPPAGLVLGVAYGTLEAGSAITGKDWISGRELDTTERWVRGAFAPLDIIPGVSGIKRFSGSVRAANYLTDMGRFGTKPTLATAVKYELNHLSNMVLEAKRMSSVRLRNAGAVIKDTSRLVANKLQKEAAATARLANDLVTGAKNIGTSRNVLAIDDINQVQMPAKGTSAVDNQVQNVLTNATGINLGTTHVPPPGKTTQFIDMMDPDDARRYQQYWNKVEVGMGTEARVATSQMSPDSFANNILPDKLKEHQISFDEFYRLKQTPDHQLTNVERAIMQDIRNAVPRPDQNTKMIKNITESDIEKYINDQYDSIRGFIAKAEDAAHIHDYQHVRESMRLDYSYYNDYTDTVIRPYPENGNSYGYIEFGVEKHYMIGPENLEIPYGSRMDSPYSGWIDNEWPWTGNGFTSSRNGEVIPEWTLTNPIELSDLTEGTKIHRVTDGIDEVVAVLVDGKFYLVR